MTPRLSLRDRVSLLLRGKAPVVRPWSELEIGAARKRMIVLQDTSKDIARGLNTMVANGRDEPPKSAA